MSRRVASSRRSPVAEGRHHAGRWLPLGAHQAVEYLLGALLVATSLQLAGSTQATLAGAGAAIIALAALSQGALGLLGAVGPRTHRVLDPALALALAASPVLYRDHLDAAAVIVSEACAVLMLRMATLTRYTRAAGASQAGRSPASQAAPGPGGPAGFPGDPDDPPRAPRGDQAAPAARQTPSTAWTLGVLAARARSRPRSLEGGARRVGRAVGRTRPSRGQGEPGSAD